MKLTTGAGGGNFSGSLGSITAVTSRHGTIFRQKVKPKDRATRRQQVNRSIFSSLLNIWTESLSNAQRESWRNWAGQTLVDGKHLTGQLAFVRSNSIRLQIGTARVDDAPTTFSNGNPVLSIETIVSGTLNAIGIHPGGTQLLMTANVATDTPTAATAALYFSRPLNQSAQFFKGPFQLATTSPILGIPPSISYFQTLSQLLSDNVDPAAGQRRAARLRIIYDDGRLSDPYSIVGPVKI